MHINIVRLHPGGSVHIDEAHCAFERPIERLSLGRFSRVEADLEVRRGGQGLGMRQIAIRMRDLRISCLSRHYGGGVLGLYRHKSAIRQSWHFGVRATQV